MPYEIIERENRYCLQKKGTNEIVPGSCHADRAMTERMMNAIMSNEKMSFYLLDKFVNVKAGEPYRLFPFGRIVKNGKSRDLTPEYAARFKLPHFKPAIKLGSHDDPTPAGGHIVALEVRADGLYAIPEYTDKGAQAVNEGAYRYHSPEVIWEDGAIEDPASGVMINGPLIIGDALLHTPHLGEAAALYATIIQENTMADNDLLTAIKDGIDKLTARLKGDESVTQTLPPINPEEFAAAIRERDELKTTLARQEADKVYMARVDRFSADLATIRASQELAGILAGLTDEQAEKIMQQLKALSAQVDVSSLIDEKGKEGAVGDDPQAAFNAAVLAVAREKKINYTVAFEQVKQTMPDLFRAAFK